MNSFPVYTLRTPSQDASPLQFYEIQNEEAALWHLLCRLGVLHCSAGASLTLSSNLFPAYGILHSTRGSVRYTPLSASESSLLLNQGQFLLIDGRVPHTLSIKDFGGFKLLLFDGCSAGCYCRTLLSDSLFFEPPSPVSLLPGYRALIRQQPVDSFQANLLLTELLTQMLFQKAPCAKIIPGYLTEIKELLDKSYYTDLTLQQLEMRSQVSRYRICREFKEHYGISPMQYLHKTRIAAARELLENSNLKIHEIASSIGYENVNHFIRHFKKAAGITPAAYRKGSLYYR